MRTRFIGSVFLAVAALSLAIASTTAAPSTQPTTRRAKPAIKLGVMESRLDLFDAEIIQDGTFHHTTYDAGNLIHLRDPKADYPFTGTWSSPTIESDFPFTELLPSWNVTVPENAGVRFEVRARDEERKDWSPWLYIGYWGRTVRDKQVTTFDDGKVDVDTLELKRPADAYELRATLSDFHEREATGSPVIRKMTVVYSRPMPADPEDRAEPRRSATTKPATLPASVNLDVPFRAQGVEVEAIRHSICSPTSVSMLLAYGGVDLPTGKNALAIWDDDNAMFGNWNRAVQYAATQGCEAWLQRFSSMDEARAVLASGQPIIASIRFKKGTFPSNLQKATAGHLIVLRGYDEHGDIIVNDPASKDRGHGVIYKADELANAWLVSTGGTAYIIRKPTTQPTTMP